MRAQTFARLLRDRCPSCGCVTEPITLDQWLQGESASLGPLTEFMGMIVKERMRASDDAARCADPVCRWQGAFLPVEVEVLCADLEVWDLS